MVGCFAFVGIACFVSHEPDEAGDANKGETPHDPGAGHVVSCRQGDDLVAEDAKLGTDTWQGENTASVTILWLIVPSSVRVPPLGLHGTAAA